MKLHHPGQKSQPKPTDKLENVCSGKPNRCSTKKEAESNIQETSDSIRSKWVFIKKNKIHRDTELFHEANKRKEEAQTDLAAFMLFRSSKSLNDLIENTWKISNAKASIERGKTTRIEILEKYHSESCVDGATWSGMSVLGKCSSWTVKIPSCLLMLWGIY